MSDAVSITVEARDPAKNKGTGSRFSRKLRSQGRIPAIIYGHKQAPQPISMTRDDVWQMIKKKTHLAQLSWGSGSEMVLVREIQWDHLGKEIIHLDFARVSADEAIETEVPLEVHGTAPGISEGGTLEVVVHAVAVSCRPTAIPNAIRVEVGSLKMGQGIHLKDVTAPEGVTLVGDPDLLLVHVVAPRTNVEPTEGVVEPEVIGRKAEDKEKKED